MGEPHLQNLRHRFDPSLKTTMLKSQSKIETADKCAKKRLERFLSIF
jgi:hypothetical protein